MNLLLEPLLPYTAYLALVLRVWVGANMITHARPKLGAGTKGTIRWIKSLGLPAGAAYLAIILELFGGIFLMIGLIVPIVALFIAIEMIANSLMKKYKMKAGYIVTGKASYEIDVLYLMLSIVLIVLGSGAASLDGLIGL
ncbi:MAG: DoxX family protein [Nitrososphaerales archaeon]